MIHPLLLAVSFLASTAAPAAAPAGPAAAQAAPAPGPVAFLIAAPGRKGDRSALNGLLFDIWGRRGDTRPAHQPDSAPGWSACVDAAGTGLDVACVQRLLPRRGDGLPVVAMFALRDDDRPYASAVHCVGASGAGSAPFLNSLTGLDGAGEGGRARNNLRSSIARCVNQAVPGAVTGAIW